MTISQRKKTRWEKYFHYSPHDNFRSSFLPVDVSKCLWATHQIWIAAVISPTLMLNHHDSSWIKSWRNPKCAINKMTKNWSFKSRVILWNNWSPSRFICTVCLLFRWNNEPAMCHGLIQSFINFSVCLWSRSNSLVIPPIYPSVTPLFTPVQSPYSPDH